MVVTASAEAKTTCAVGVKFGSELGNYFFVFYLIFLPEHFINIPSS